MHALITGASSGIGEALARVLSLAGYDLTLVARRRAELDRVIGTLTGGKQARAIAADLGDLDGIAGIVEDAVQGLAPIDLLVNNAGVQIVGRTEDVSIADGERLLILNVFAPFRLTQTILPSMIARKSGTIVDMASLAALTTPPGMFHYGASKAALATASESLRAEVKPYGVHVVTVYPGPVKTAMSDSAVTNYDKVPKLPTGTADGLAHLILDAIEQRYPRVIYPRVYTASRIFPGLSRWMTDALSPVPRKKS